MVTFKPTDTTDYTFASDNVTINVAKAQLTVAANSAAINAGQAIPELTVSYSGFVNGDTPAVLTQAPSVTTSATSASPAGSYPIVAAGASAVNYTITFVSGTLAVNPARDGRGRLNPKGQDGKT